MSKLSYTIRDFGGEVSAHSFNVAQLTAANHDAQVALYSAYETALGNITRGVIAKRRWVHTSANVSNADATDEEAQREEKLFIQYEDANKYLGGFEVACADISALTRITGTDFVELEDSDVMEAYVTALEAVATSHKDGSSAITVLRAILVGVRS